MPLSIIIVIGWLYVSILASITEPSLVGGILTFLFSGALPCGLLLYFAGTRIRRERRKFRELMAERAEKEAAGKAAREAGDSARPGEER